MAPSPKPLKAEERLHMKNLKGTTKVYNIATLKQRVSEHIKEVQKTTAQETSRMQQITLKEQFTRINVMSADEFMKRDRIMENVKMLMEIVGKNSGKDESSPQIPSSSSSSSTKVKEAGPKKKVELKFSGPPLKENQHFFDVLTDGMEKKFYKMVANKLKKGEVAGTSGGEKTTTTTTTAAADLDEEEEILGMQPPTPSPIVSTSSGEGSSTSEETEDYRKVYTASGGEANAAGGVSWSVEVEQAAYSPASDDDDAFSLSNVDIDFESIEIVSESLSQPGQKIMESCLKKINEVFPSESEVGKDKKNDKPAPTVPYENALKQAYAFCQFWCMLVYGHPPLPKENMEDIARNLYKVVIKEDEEEEERPPPTPAKAEEAAAVAAKTIKKKKKKKSKSQK